jgi:hypothetical protein
MLWKPETCLVDKSTTFQATTCLTPTHQGAATHPLGRAANPHCTQGASRPATALQHAPHCQTEDRRTPPPLQTAMEPVAGPQARFAGRSRRGSACRTASPSGNSVSRQRHGRTRRPSINSGVAVDGDKPAAPGSWPCRHGDGDSDRAAARPRRHHAALPW